MIFGGEGYGKENEGGWEWLGNFGVCYLFLYGVHLRGWECGGCMLIAPEKKTRGKGGERVFFY